jgi:hypothetical protein
LNASSVPAFGHVSATHVGVNNRRGADKVGCHRCSRYITKHRCENRIRSVAIPYLISPVTALQIMLSTRCPAHVTLRICALEHNLTRLPRQVTKRSGQNGVEKLEMFPFRPACSCRKRWSMQQAVSRCLLGRVFLFVLPNRQNCTAPNSARKKCTTFGWGLSTVNGAGCSRHHYSTI